MMTTTSVNRLRGLFGAKPGRLGRAAAALLGALVLAAVSGPVAAFEFFNPTLPYTATRVINVEGKVLYGRVQHTPGLTREDLVVDGKQHSLILNMPGNSAVMLMHKAKMAVEVPFSLARGVFSAIPDDLTALVPAGETSLMGYTVGIYDFSSEHGRGRLWMTEEGIVLQGSGFGQNGARYSMRLKDLKIAKPDPRVFRIPTAYRRIFINTGSLTGFNLQEMINALPK